MNFKFIRIENEMNFGKNATQEEEKKRFVNGVSMQS